MRSRDRFAALIAHEFRRARRSAWNRLLYSAIAVGVTLFVTRAFDFAYLLSARPEANGSEQAIPGQAVMWGLIMLVFLGYSTFDEYAHRTWARLEVSGAAPREIIGSKLIVTAVSQTLHVVALYAIGIVAFGLKVRGSWSALGLLILLIAAVTTSFGVLGIALMRTEAAFTVWCWIGALGMTALGGGLAPYDFLPGWARAVSPVAPTYWIFRTSQELLLDGATAADVAWRLAVIAAFAMGFAAAGAIAFDPHRSLRSTGL